jgi:hypothetical protein
MLRHLTYSPAATSAIDGAEQEVRALQAQLHEAEAGAASAAEAERRVSQGLEEEERRQRSALLAAVRKSVSAVESEAQRALDCFGCAKAAGADEGAQQQAAALLTRVSAVASDPVQLAAAVSPLGAAASCAAERMRRLAKTVEACAPADDAASSALIMAGRMLAAGLAHLAATAQAMAVEGAAESSGIFLVADSAASRLAPLAAALARQPVEPSELLAAARGALALAGQLGGADSYGLDSSSLAGIAAGAARWPAAAQAVGSGRSFLLRLLVSSVRCAALDNPNDRGLAAINARLATLLAADLDAQPSLAALLTAPRTELLPVVERCGDQLPHMLAALRSVKLAAAHGYAGNPAVMAAEAQAQAERLAGPFLQPAFCASRLSATLLAAAEGAHTVAARLQGTGQPDSAVGSELVAGLTAALRAFKPLAELTPQRFLDQSSAATTAEAAPPAIEQLESALAALALACSRGPRQASPSTAAAGGDKPGLTELSDQLSLFNNIQLRTLFVAGVEAEAARFAAAADSAINGERTRQGHESVVSIGAAHVLSLWPLSPNAAHVRHVSNMLPSELWINTGAEATPDAFALNSQAVQLGGTLQLPSLTRLLQCALAAGHRGALSVSDAEAMDSAVPAAAVAELEAAEPHAQLIRCGLVGAG